MKDPGIVAGYIHHDSQVGVLIELECESDTLTKCEEFKDFARNLCKQLAAYPLTPDVSDLLYQDYILAPTITIREYWENNKEFFGEKIYIKRFKIFNRKPTSQRVALLQYHFDDTGMDARDDVLELADLSEEYFGDDDHEDGFDKPWEYFLEKIQKNLSQKQIDEFLHINDITEVIPGYFLVAAELLWSAGFDISKHKKNIHRAFKLEITDIGNMNHTYIADVANDMFQAYENMFGFKYGSKSDHQIEDN